MGFSAPFREPLMSPVYSTGVATAVTPWYLQGGVTLAQCTLAYQPIHAADLASSKINLAHSGTNDAFAGTNPSFADSTGWGFNGTSQYLRTGVTPSANQTESLIVRYSGWSTKATTSSLGGCWNSLVARFLGLELGATGDDQIYYGNGSYVAKATRLAAAVLCVAGNKAYRNGVDEGSTISNGANVAPAELYIASTDRGGTTNFFVGNILAWAFYNIVLSSTQVSLISAAMALL